MIGILRGIALFQITVSSGGARLTAPVLDFPEPGLDDTASYQGYQTRFYRDSKQNTVQIYLEPRSGRVVTLWADGANASIGFTVRDRRGRPVALRWGADSVEVADSGALRTLAYDLVADASAIEIGWFLLGSMRVERDLQYARRHLLPFHAPPFRVAEESVLVSRVAGLPGSERQRHLQLLRAATLAELRSRLDPTIGWSTPGTRRGSRIGHESLDGRNRLTLEITAIGPDAVLQVHSRTVAVRTRDGSRIALRVRVSTDAAVLSPLTRFEIFQPAFLATLAAARDTTDSEAVIRRRRLERQVRAVELLSSKEKLMAGLPNFATYFGRDMMMTALMMRPIWTPAMAEHVLASVLRKLGPGGHVSHEEALGGQAIRENAQRYDSVITAWRKAARGERQAPESLLRGARRVLTNLQETRENYHMIDDELQLPVLAARYLADPEVDASRKRAFLNDTAGGRGSRLSLLLAELALVADQTQAYVNDPRPENLIGFPKRDSVHWRAASWRDSDAGYAGGRFAMDVNAIWAPEALQAIDTILATLRDLGLGPVQLDSLLPAPRASTLRAYLRDPTAIGRAARIWRGARRHFEVVLGGAELRKRFAAKLAWLPEGERRYWEHVVTSRGGVPDTLRYLALALDSAGTPIPVVNTDPATGLLLRDYTQELTAGAATVESVLADVAPFGIPFPAGLLVDGLGPLVANDAYASRDVWERFERDQYHGPRAVWGREVNLLLIGLANQIARAYAPDGHLRDPSLAPYVRSLHSTLRRTLAAVRASGLQHNELWSYRIANGMLRPIRYGTSSDVQLWNTTELVVEHALARLPD
ncbi:MAG TPA: hypothetical protein VFM14_00515 [Gemmatimonadales bacterium]|nr:hypothetical protein [Gemmatimonadales bacterium]